MKHGKGTYKWADGRKYSGTWSRGLREGKGVYTLQNGKGRNGIWRADQRLSWID